MAAFGLSGTPHVPDTTLVLRKEGLRSCGQVIGTPGAGSVSARQRSVEDVQILFTFSRKEDVVFSKQELKELASFRSDTSPVLSVYLNVDVTQLTAEQYRLTLRGMLKSVADRAAPEDIVAVERYLGLEYDWQGKGIAIFSATDFNASRERYRCCFWTS